MNRKVIFICVLALGITSLFQSGYILYRDEGYDVGFYEDWFNLSQNNDSCSMRFPTDTPRGIEGVYSHPNYICVWTKGNSEEKIISTWYHEMAHLYAHRSPSHFNVGDET